MGGGPSGSDATGSPIASREVVAKGLVRHVALMLRQEREKTLVVGRWHVKRRDELSVTAASFHQAAPNHLAHIPAREIVSLETLVDHGPEVFPRFETRPRLFNLRRTGRPGSCGGLARRSVGLLGCGHV